MLAMHVVPSRLTLYLSQLFSCRSIRLLSVFLCCSTPFCGPVLDGPAVGTVTLTRNARQLGVQDPVVAGQGNREYVRAASEGDFCSISKPIPAVRGTKEKICPSYRMLGSSWHGSVGSPCGLFSHGNLFQKSIALSPQLPKNPAAHERYSLVINIRDNDFDPLPFAALPTTGAATAWPSAPTGIIRQDPRSWAYTCGPVTIGAGL